MSFYKNINIIRAVCDLQNGIPVSAILNEGLKSARKKFYFIKDAINNNFPQNTQYEVITTKENKTHNILYQNANLPQSKEEEQLIEITKLLELQPILIAFTSLPSDFTGIVINEIKHAEVQNFILEFKNELNFFEKSPIQLKMAENCEFYVFKTPYLNKEHYIIKIKNPEKDEVPLIRVHSSCYTGDLLASLRCDCRDQLQESIKFINNNPNFNGGYILYLMQEGRGIGLANKIKAYKLQQLDGLDTVDSNLALGFKDDERNFMPAVKMLEFLKIKEVFLLTNNPKKVQDLKSLGVNIKNSINTVFAKNEYNEDYLKIKEERMKHSFKN